MSPTQAPWKELTDSDYSAFRTALLKERGSLRQRDFLAKVRDTSQFLDHMSSLATVGIKDADLAPYPMTESEFKDPPADSEQALYKSWSALTPAIACRSTFWANLTLEHIRHQRIESVFLAANGGNLPGGAERIDFALSDDTSQGSQRVDSCVRTVLRRLGGLPEIRGNRSVFVDCPFARAWWRERMVEQAANGDNQVAAQVRTVLRTNQTYWEKLIDRVVFRNSTFGSTNIRNSFVRVLGHHLVSNGSADISNTANLQRLCRLATAYQGTRELSILSHDELDSMMHTVVIESNSR